MSPEIHDQKERLMFVWTKTNVIITHKQYQHIHIIKASCEADDNSNESVSHELPITQPSWYLQLKI